MSQEKLAKLICVSRKVVTLMEKGDPTVSFGAYATAASIMGLESGLLETFASEEELVFQHKTRLAMRRRVRHRNPRKDDLDF